MKNARLILMRHGESIYNQKNLFTGWTDIDLSGQGIVEAKEAGQLLRRHNIYPDICFTSWLKRAIHTAQLTLRELEWEHIDSLRSYKLNERHYGAWQGRDKDAVKKKSGESKFLAVRRGYDVAPPALLLNENLVIKNDKKYKNIKENLLPLSESLKDTKKRVIEYYHEKIEAELLKNKTVLISAHGNSLRALVMYLEKMSEEEIVKFEIPTGEIISYTLDSNLNLINKEVFH